MKERSWLFALVAAGAMVLGLSDTSSAGFANDDGYSYTQPGAELVMPYDTEEGRVTFLVASNISGRLVTTHWIFWNESCNEEVDFSICLTPNDTVVVDPRNMQGIDANNEAVGPAISLSGVKGLATVIAYESDGDCTPYGAEGEDEYPIADNALVGSFTFADTNNGYSFGNDALALGIDGGVVQVPEPASGNDYEFVIQTFNPDSVDASLVVLSHLREWSDDTVRPSALPIRLSTNFVDTTEIPTSLPDTTVSCTEFYSISDNLIPAATTVSTSGILRMQPQAGLTAGTDYLYGIVGQAISAYGSSSSVKVEQIPGSASPAFIDGTDSGLF